MSVWRGFGLLFINRALREIRNYTNGRKTRENIRFKFKSFKSKWLTLYVRNRFRRKILGLKLESYKLGSGLHPPPSGGGAPPAGLGCFGTINMYPYLNMVLVAFKM